MKRFGRDIALLTLPVLIFCGVAWWKTRGGSVAQLQGAPSDIYSGKPRLEIGEIKPLEMSPWDVARGWVWGVKVNLWQGGQSPVAPGTLRAANEVGTRHVDVFFRRGARWMRAKAADGTSLIQETYSNDQFLGDFALRRDLRVCAQRE